jgi:Zn-dependent protease with chaperone function
MSVVAGPVDRVHFADEQRRYRRKSWRFSVMAAIAALATGIPASIVATPVVYAVVLVVAYLINLVIPLEQGTWAALEKLSQAIPVAVDTIDRAGGWRNWPTIAAAAGVLVLPGAVLMLVLWLAVRALIGRVGVGAALEQIGARPLNARDIEEQQLGNLVQEMAIAAGVRPPRVMIIDDPVATNAAATGLDFDDATILVTRKLLDTLDRDETQAVIAHLVGSIGNGDLTIASIIFSIYQTWGALTLLMEAPFDGVQRKKLWRVVRVAFRGRTREVDRWEAEFASDVLLRSSENANEGEDPFTRHENRAPGIGKFFSWILVTAYLPFALGVQVVRLAVFVSSLLLIGPLIGLMWRTRRHLADAMAVQLTRYPDPLVRAIHKLGVAATSAVPKGGALSFLFFVWPFATSSSDAVIGQFSRMQPKVHRRQQRLRALGATNVVAPKGFFASLTKRDLFAVVFWLVLSPLYTVAFGAMIVLVVMLTMLTLMVMMIMMFAVWGILRLVFVLIPGWIAG